MKTLIDKKNMLIAVKGNHEEYLLKGLPEKIHDNKRCMKLKEIENHKWTFSQISKSSKEFISSLPEYINIDIENKKIYIVHYPRDEKNVFKKHIKYPTVEENQEMFYGIDADIFLYGHTHTENINNSFNNMYINIGSLGCPEYTKVAKAGILKIDNGKVYFEFLNIKYNVDLVIKDIENIKFPFYEEILEIFYGVKK